jgi:hypothetical protein
VIGSNDENSSNVSEVGIGFIFGRKKEFPSTVANYDREYLLNMFK